MKAPYLSVYLVAALIAGCYAAPVKPGLADQTALRDAKFVVWIRPANLEAVREICENPLALGCQRWKNGICYVVAMDYGGDTLTTLGHELKHCFDGAWHPANGVIQSRERK